MNTSTSKYVHYCYRCNTEISPADGDHWYELPHHTGGHATYCGHCYNLRMFAIGDLEKCTTLPQLQVMARAANIRGRSGMNKRALVSAILSHDWDEMHYAQHNTDAVPNTVALHTVTGAPDATPDAETLVCPDCGDGVDVPGMCNTCRHAEYHQSPARTQPRDTDTDTDTDTTPVRVGMLEKYAVRWTEYEYMHKCETYHSMSGALDHAAALLHRRAGAGDRPEYVQIARMYGDVHTGDSTTLYHAPRWRAGDTVKYISGDGDVLDIEIETVRPMWDWHRARGDWYLTHKYGASVVFDNWATTRGNVIRARCSSGAIVYPDAVVRADRYGEMAAVYDTDAIEYSVEMLDGLAHEYGQSPSPETRAGDLERIRARVVRDLLEVHTVVQRDRVHHADEMVRETLRTLSHMAYTFALVLQDETDLCSGALQYALPVLQHAAALVSAVTPDNATPALWRGTALDLERMVDRGHIRRAGY